MDQNKKPMALRNVLTRLLITTVRHMCCKLLCRQMCCEIPAAASKAVPCYLHELNPVLLIP